MADEDFPSGPWTGYYQYPDGRRSGMDLQLRFFKGQISGSGLDEVGGFSVDGTYNDANHEAEWVKSFPDGHQVLYRGFREGPVPGIWGTWQIPGNWSGGFHIWPLASGGGDRESLRIAKPQERQRAGVGVGAGSSD